MDKNPPAILNLHARYALANGNVSISGIRAGLLGGQMTGSFNMRDLTGNTNSNLAARLNSISVAEIEGLLGPSTAGHVNVHGSLGAIADAKWGKNTDDLVAHANVTLKAGLPPAHGGPETPLNGLIRGTYTASSGVLSLAQSSIGTPQTSILLDGSISQQSALRVRVESRNLHELEEIAQGFQASGFKPLDLYGQASLNATVKGSTRYPKIEGQLTASDLKVRGTSWKLLRAQAAADPNSVRVENGELISATKGRVTFNLNSALQQWAVTPASAFAFGLLLPD